MSQRDHRINYYNSDGEIERIEWWEEGECQCVFYNTNLAAFRLAAWELKEEENNRKIKEILKIQLEELDKRRSGRNTKISPGKIRSWCFTLNNYTKEDINNLLEDIKDEKYIFQEEKGANETRHLQGVVTFRNQVRFVTVKKIMGKAHWEKCKNTLAARNYCRKSSTRNGDVWDNTTG